MVIKLAITIDEVIKDREGCGCTKEQLEENFRNLFDSYIVDGWKVIDCKIEN